MNKRKTIAVPKRADEKFSLHEFFGKDVFEKSAELFEYVNRPMFKRKDAGVTYRNLFWWADEGILDIGAKEYGKFTFVELVWVKIVEQLRTFNVPLPLIAIYKKNLFETIKITGLPDKKEKLKSYLDNLDIAAEDKSRLLETVETKANKKSTDTGVTVLQLLIISCILKRKFLAIAFFADGFSLIVDREAERLYTQANRERLENGHYVRVSVSKILAEYLKSELAFKTVPELRLLTLAENKLYEAIKTGEYDSIVIHFKDKKIKSLELKKSAGVQRKIIDLLNEGNFAEIIVKKHNGVVTKIEQNIKLAF